GPAWCSSGSNERRPSEFVGAREPLDAVAMRRIPTVRPRNNGGRRLVLATCLLVAGCSRSNDSQPAPPAPAPEPSSAVMPEQPPAAAPSEDAKAAPEASPAPLDPDPRTLPGSHSTSIGSPTE